MSRILILAFSAIVLVGCINNDEHYQPSMLEEGFLQHMSLHHDQAITMALFAQQNTEGRVRAYALEILTKQSAEIGQMRGWLQLWARPILPTRATESWMEVADDEESMAYAALCAEYDGAMPGMASPEELTALRNAVGVEAEILFLQLMIRHHQGGIPMLRIAARYTRIPVIQQLVSAMQYEQIQELGSLLRELKSLDATPLATPLGSAPLFMSN